ncbi:MAG: hypothetical protein ACYCS7_02555 [Acidimicrobiales bacterium]
MNMTLWRGRRHVSRLLLLRALLGGGLAAYLATVGAMNMAILAASGTPAKLIDIQGPFTQDPLGPIVDVTGHWKHYQPAEKFCVQPDVAEFPATTDATQTGADPACRFAGFGHLATGLYKVHISTPPLCAGCHRLFLDYSKIRANQALMPAAHGHAYFRPMSLNPTYRVAPTAHSPNVKNLTNDSLVAPPGTPIPDVTTLFDTHVMAYVGDTAHFAHIAAQGPYYVGPWYVNTAGQRIDGAYLDVNLSQAVSLGNGLLDGIGYAAGFDANPGLCPDTLLLGAAYADGNYFYGGCVNFFGASALPGIDPWRGK